MSTVSPPAWTPSPPSTTSPLWLPERGRFQAVLELTVLRNPWIPTNPHFKQSLFLAYEGREALYGGAAGGGKSEALLMAALQWIPCPGYSALLLRRSFRDLNQPDALIPRSKEWLYETGAHWSEQEKRWTFPKGATLTFGYLDRPDDIYQYMGAAYQFIGFDELTQFTEEQYRYLFSRLRGRPNVDAPLRMRAASNPGGIGHDWVKKRFVLPAEPGRDRIFIPARLADNPSLDRDQYTASLNQLDPITRAQLLDGDWQAYEGGRFKRSWFRRFRCTEQGYVLDGTQRPYHYHEPWQFVTCDPAATEKETADYTVIATFAVMPNRDLLVLDVVRERLALDEIAPAIARVCGRFSPSYVAIEATGFQWAIVLAARRQPGIPTVKAIEPAGKGKLVRATPAIIRAEQGGLFLPHAAPWLEDFESELVQFTGDDKRDAHDDQVDALAYAVQELDRWAPFEMPKQPDKLPRDDSHAARCGLFGRGNTQSEAERRGLYGRGQGNGFVEC